MSSSSFQDLPKQYDPGPAQERWYKLWEERGYFQSDPDDSRRPFTIVIPPPNVTGALHLGHALNTTLQDIVIRFKRMQGFNVLWVPGTDHAGIATQAMVEKRLRQEENKSRHDLGRQGLVDRIWAWKDQYETRILNQLRQMGASCDWRRTRFTLDEMCARAVRHTFFRLFQDGKIYRGRRLVNWDTFLQTAVSDDEVYHEAVKGHFWHFRYPVIDPQPGEPTHVTIATTRPETMLGDTAVAVHPDPGKALAVAETELAAKLADAPTKERPAIQVQLEELAARRQTMLPQLVKLRDMALAGRKVMLPLLNREIPLVADEWAKPELGSGCVKITPAHDPNDYEVGLRQKLPMINVMNSDGTLNDNAGPYKGLKTAEGRKRVVADLEQLGLVEKVEDREIDLAHSDRSKTAIEPLLADQWFVKMDELAQSAMDAVSDGRVKITPARYAKSYLDWLGEKRDWPVSRQLWWGHRIPVWTAFVGPRETIIETGDQGAISRDQNAARTELLAYLNAAGVASADCAIDFPDARTLRFCSCEERADKALEALNRWRESLGPHERKPGLETPSAMPSVFGSESALESGLKVKHVHQLRQDPDVLDTWFSSALWPHSTLGWPEETPELKYYYPTSLLITSRDIITLWVARMVLTGLYNVGDIPFHEVFIHPKILDRYGETMSKSKGNGIDPLDIVQKFGADSLRFGLADMTTGTQDIRMPVEFECPHCLKPIEQTHKNRESPRIKCSHCGQDFSTQWAKKPDDVALPRGAVIAERFEKGRNFCNKLWNAARFTLLNFEGFSPGKVDDAQLAVEDRWLLSRLSTVTAQVTTALEEYRYADASRLLYDFAWDEFCSFYLEMTKGRLQDEAARPTAQRVLAHTLDALLRLLHPVTPFVTEEIWNLLGQAAPQRGLTAPRPAAESVMIAAWPQADAARQDPQIEARFGRFQALLAGLRDIRSRQNLPPKTPIRFSLRCDAETVDLLSPMKPYFESMAGAQWTAAGPDVTPPPMNATLSIGGAEVFVDLAGLIDVEAEKERLEKERQKLLGLIAAKEKKLTNENFVQRAPADVVQKERDSLKELQDRLNSIAAALKELLASPTLSTKDHSVE